MSSPQDFPAAHSMDSEWFGVDAHGRVAYFDTGENGPLPHAAQTWRWEYLELWTFLEQLELPVEDDLPWLKLPSNDAWLKFWERLTPLAEVIAQTLDNTHRGLRHRLEHPGPEQPSIEPFSGHAPVSELCLVMRDKASLLKLIPACWDDCFAVELGQDYLLLAKLIDTVALVDSFQRGEILAGRSLQWQDERALAELFSLFTYEHQHYGIDPSYARTFAPTHPITIERFKPEMRRRLELLRMSNDDFAAQERVNPEDSFDCERW